MRTVFPSRSSTRLLRAIASLSRLPPTEPGFLLCLLHTHRHSQVLGAEPELWSQLLLSMAQLLAFAPVLGASSDGPFFRLWRTAIAAAPRSPEALGDRELRHVFLARCIFLACLPSGRSQAELEPLGPQLLKLAESCWRRDGSRSLAAVRQQNQHPESRAEADLALGNLSEALRDLGYGPSLEALTEDGLFFVDLILETQGRRIACVVEDTAVSAPTGRRPRRRLGWSFVQERLLEARGFECHVISRYELRGLARSPERAALYARNKLQLVGHGGGSSEQDEGSSGALPELD